MSGIVVWLPARKQTPERLAPACRRQRGINGRHVFDTTLGRRHPQLLTRAGLRHVDNECITRIVRAPSIRSRLAKKTMSRFYELARTEGVSDADWHTFLSAYDDPTFEMVGMMLVQAWGWR
jgi:hypothetical protein